jgi:hypothetical protein
VDQITSYHNCGSVGTLHSFILSKVTISWSYNVEQEKMMSNCYLCIHKCLVNDMRILIWTVSKPLCIVHRQVDEARVDKLIKCTIAFRRLALIAYFF